MEIATKIAWLMLAAVHGPPAAVFFWPAAVQRLYGVSPEGSAGLLLTHRGAAFLAVAVAAVWAAFDPPVPRMSSVLVGICVLGYLLVYVRAGMPDGPLRTVAVVDALALAPLLLVARSAWRPVPKRCPAGS